MEDEAVLQKTVAIFTDISGIKKLEKEREAVIMQLQEALNSIKTLSGWVSICANCKKKGLSGFPKLSSFSRLWC